MFSSQFFPTRLRCAKNKQKCEWAKTIGFSGNIKNPRVSRRSDSKPARFNKTPLHNLSLPSQLASTTGFPQFFGPRCPTDVYEHFPQLHSSQNPLCPLLFSQVNFSVIAGKDASRVDHKRTLSPLSKRIEKTWNNSKICLDKDFEMDWNFQKWIRSIFFSEMENLWRHASWFVCLSALIVFHLKDHWRRDFEKRNDDSASGLF